MRRLALVAPVVGLVLVGCSDEAPDPKIAPTPTDTSSAAPSPTSDPTPTGPVEPTLPAEVAGTDADAAEAFVEFYWETVNYAQATGEIEGLRGLGAESCAGCRGGWQGIEETYSSGGTISGGQLDLRRVEASQITSNDGLAFSADAAVWAESQQIKAPGGETEKNPGGLFEVAMIVVNRGGEWVVARMDVS